MVELNNNLRGTNSPVVDAYLRNLTEYRASVENAILPLISYFVDMTEEQGVKVILPSSIFEDQKNYLRRLGERYHKRDFDVIVKPEDVTLKIYDIITRLVRINKKAVQHSLCDCIDFMFKHESLFKDVKINYNLAKAIQEETKEYNHQQSAKLDEIIKQEEARQKKCQQIKNKNITYPSFTKFLSPQHLYIFMFDHMKRAVDFELLKLYDFLSEYDIQTVHSNKLKEIEEELKRRGEGEYTKWALLVNIKPHEETTPMSHDDIFIDEWCANIRRGLEAQEKTVKDFMNYMAIPEGKVVKEMYLMGAYPDHISLLHHYFKGKIPKEFKV